MQRYSMMHLNAVNFDYLNGLLVSAGRRARTVPAAAGACGYDGTGGLKPFEPEELLAGTSLLDRFSMDDAQEFVLKTSVSMNQKVMQIYEALVNDCRRRVECRDYTT